MIEISMNDSFGRTIGLYSEKCKIALEIGGGTGQGSSRCIKSKNCLLVRIWIFFHSGTGSDLFWGLQCHVENGSKLF